MKRYARPFFAITFVVVLIGLILNLVSTARNDSADFVMGHFFSPAARAANQLSYFSFETAVLVAVVALLLAFRWQRRSTAFAVLLVNSVVGIVVSGIVYYVLLAGKYDYDTIGYVGTTIIHTVAPVLAIVGFVLFIPRGLVTGKVVWLSLIYPLIYLAFTIIRGSIIDWYPYNFVNVDSLGGGRVALNSVGLALAMLGLAALAGLVDRRLSRTV